MRSRDALRRLPGLLAFLLVLTVTTTAAVVGAGSMFYEGWGQPPLRMATYLAPAAVLIVLGLVAIRWPVAGGLSLLLLGGGAGWRWVARQAARSTSSESLLPTVLVMIGPVVLAALLFMADAWSRRRADATAWDAARRRSGRHWRPLLLVLLPVLATAALAYQQVPSLLARHDDGKRGARVIGEGPGALAWAPRGPGWNATHANGAYPSWATLMRHRGTMRDRCEYLDADGKTVLDDPAGIWRLPTVGEVVGALTRDGKDAGCTWDHRSPHAACRVPPDKETPLWAPDDAPIYYWSRQEASAAQAFAVNYTGGISVLPKAVEGLGIGFRCVKPAGPPTSSSRPPSSAPRT